MRFCSKPGCAHTGTVVLSYEYAAGRVILEDLGDEAVSPHVYVLCESCAGRLTPPRGWVVEDQRAAALFLTEIPDSLAG